MPAKKLAVKEMLKTRSEWGRRRFRDHVDHQRKIKKHLPRGSMGQFILRKLGAPCSTCTVRRKISTPTSPKAIVEMVVSIKTIVAHPPLEIRDP
jgi:hypothetical protein